MKLYELVQEFRSIADQLEEMELDQETMKDTLDSLQLPIEEKVENIIKLMKSTEALADAKKLEAKRLSESASSDLKKVEWFKQYLSDNLQAANIKDLQAGVFKVNFRKGTEVVKIDEEKLPDAYRVFETIAKPLPKAELKKLLQRGDHIPGVEIVRNPDTLQVK